MLALPTVSIRSMQRSRAFIWTNVSNTRWSAVFAGRQASIAAHSGAFALQAMHCGLRCPSQWITTRTVPKAIGANAQKNSLEVEAIHAGVEEVLIVVIRVPFDALIFDPPEEVCADVECLTAMHRQAFSILPPGGACQLLPWVVSAGG